ncbi:Sec-independent protein translocase subunit TatA [Frankia sp. CNm7]|uniref:Sec-independent protein translocase protein TatA n=1 Tax=Frankia nepalensis TaxID=1836974 RepID=A0A937UMS1_9ACTN|nr:Sec-independent protein translocase subunit TatA [Frankia nepalensis]MBL7502555.1 Sec-independent protein translocase subunit TatA [Frankia nepalensis]MBL7511743.1 Sec-independent protein translocase subunit TatA [Frankia nepalensis]MBL7520065.1 Sec-independent protein translocase subunit TatA [Frankia nepalensis]MBL7629129.1 Sec-independent protein translocase subunit TatA [Frankia nepalensis]
MPNLGTTEIIIIAIVVLVLFGAKKLPEASRSLGRSLRIFKAETKGLREDDVTPAPQPSPTPVATPVAELSPPAPVVTPSANGAAPVEAPKQS